MRKKLVTLSLLLLLCTSLMFASITVEGQLGLYIYQITQQGQTTPLDYATVGLPVNLVGTINTSNGSYNVWFDDILVDSNNSVGYYVNSNFTIPHVISGQYTVTLMDVAQNANTTTVLIIEKDYSIKPSLPEAPQILQQGEPVLFEVSVTGAQPETTFGANITISLPPPLSTNYSQVVSVTANSSGTAAARLSFPSDVFVPIDSTTKYTGTYTAYFNLTDNLAQSTFFVGFTDSDQYSRGDTVEIRAVGYQPGQAGTLKIESDAGEVFSQPVTASETGVITSSWAIPSTASLGTYNVTITPQAPQKAILDTQTFEIPGQPVGIRTLNLAGEVVSDLTVEAHDHASDEIISGSTYYDGFVYLSLEEGNHTMTAFWNGVKVGEKTVFVEVGASYDVICELTNLDIIVKNADDIPIPNTELSLTYQFIETKSGVSQTKNLFGKTSFSGVYSVNSTLPNINYTVTASKYGVIFNNGNNSIDNLPAEPNYSVVILCPDKSLTLSTVDYNKSPIPDTRIRLIEKDSGLFYGGLTNTLGEISLDVTLGEYNLQIYSGDILLTEITLSVLDETYNQIQCSIYNIDISVKVLDYFGNPLPNVALTFNRFGMNPLFGTTDNSGVYTFEKVIGGPVDILAYPVNNDEIYVAKTEYIDSPSTIQISMANYVALGSFVVGIRLLFSLLILLAALFSFILLEFIVLKKINYLKPKT